MNLKPEHLAQHLQRGLAPLYLLAGDEFLLVQEGADAVRAKAREAGFSEREVMYADAGFDWGRLARAGENLSLFGERRLLELRLDARLGTDGSAALRAWARRAPSDIVLLVIAGALDRKARQAAWYRDVERAGVSVYAWPVKGESLRRWIADRMRARGLAAEPAVVGLLIERTEGNLLACAQEIDKLALLFPDGFADARAVAAAVADSARFDVFDLPDQILAGAVHGSVRRLDRLREEGVDPVLVLWSLTRDLRVLVRASASVARGISPHQALDRAGVWKSRRRAFAGALERIDHDQALRLLDRAGKVDRVVKGAASGRPWEELLKLCVGACPQSSAAPRGTRDAVSHGAGR